MYIKLSKHMYKAPLQPCVFFAYENGAGKRARRQGHSCRGFVHGVKTKESETEGDLGTWGAKGREWRRKMRSGKGKGH